MRAASTIRLSPCAPNAPAATPSKAKIEPTTVQFTFPERPRPAADRDPSGLGFLRLGEMELQYPVGYAGGDAVGVDVAREAEAAQVVADAVFGVDGVQILVVVEPHSALDGQHAVVKT